MGCCCSKKNEDKWAVENFVDGAVLKDRSCTDCPCILAFLVFIAGWVVLLAVAFTQGVPERIIMPSNYREELCGDGRLANYTDYFAPLPNRPNYGLCVPACPAFGDYVCNNDLEPLAGDPARTLVPNHYYSHTTAEFLAGKDAVLKCITSCSAAESEKSKRYITLLSKMQENKCFFTIYPSHVTLYRCLPFEIASSNATIREMANASATVLSDLADTLGVGSFFMRGFSECQQTWRVILITCFTAVVLSMIWIFLLRWVMAPIVYLCIILVFAIFVIIGVLALLQADDLEKLALPGEQGTNDQVKVWRAIEYCAFILAGMYIVLILVIIKRIRIAIILMEESSKAFLANPVMVVLPIITMIALIGFAALFVASTIFIQTMGDTKIETFENYVTDFIGQDNLNKTEMALAAGGAFVSELFNTSAIDNVTSFNATYYDSPIPIKGLHAFNFFMFLWMGNFWIMFAFFIMALIIVTWYFSATTFATTFDMVAHEKGQENGRVKGTPTGTFCRSILVAIRYHLGTIIFGALVIAIIQFIRALVLYIEKEFLDKWKNNATVKAAICLLNCCLACIERFIRAVSKSAFVITCVTNQNFCLSAMEALGIMVTNIVQTGTLQTLSIAACVVLKVFIMVSNLLIAYGLMQVTAITDDRTVESGLFPLFFIALISLAIACLFVNIFEACVDTIMMCFFLDEKHFEGKFMPPTLSKLVGCFQNVEKARKEYEAQQKLAVAEI